MSEVIQQTDSLSGGDLDHGYGQDIANEMHRNLMIWAREYVGSMDAPVNDILDPVGPETSYTGELDSYRQILRDIPVLGKDEERALFEKIDKAKLATAKVVIDGICFANGMPGMFEPAEKDLSDIADGVAAKKSLAYHNLRLVAWLVSRYQFKTDSILEAGDLLSEGMFGLDNAIDRFDVSTGNAFSTFAVPWVRNGITRAARSVSIIPEHHHVKIKPIKSLLKAGMTHEEIAKELHMTTRSVTSIIDFISTPKSLDVPISNGSSDKVLGDMIADSNSEDPYNIIEQQISIMGLFDELNERQSRVLRLRYGIGSPEGPMTLEEIAKLEGCSGPRIRQIEKSALEKLRLIVERKGLTQEEHLVSS
ncbi:sigma-70 family RNA polymerase sigma factor [Candidatus Saccharibacteria bacterium]|nr:sigma-70 family RNA polymerase sigma factor [Candidatus Saccharibacteria bacterium]